MASGMDDEEPMSVEEEEEEDPYAEFLIIDRNYQHKFAIPSYLTLLDSASFSDYEVDFYLNKTQQMCEHEYSALIKGIPENFPPATGLDRMVAQNKAAEKALEVLSRRCYTVKYRSHQPEITLLDIFKDILPPAVAPVSQPPIQINIQEMTISNMVNHGFKPEGTKLDIAQAGHNQTSMPYKHPVRMASVAAGPDTFGSKMLKKMGWDGGGLGKDGHGIIEPISSSLVSGRFGFGHLKRKEIEETAERVGQPNQPANTGKKKQKKALVKQLPKQPVPLKKIRDERFTHRVRMVIQDFIENSDNEDLIFSTKLTAIQRKLVHDLAPEYNLTSISFGYKSNRHLVLFRAHSVDEFIERCIEKSKGNILMNFQVIPPSVDSKELFLQKLAENKGSVVKQRYKEASPRFKFMIIDRNYNRNLSMASYLILLDSANFLGYKVKFCLASNESHCHRYSVRIMELHESFPSGTGKDKMAACNSAAEKALQCLSRRFYTVKYRRHESEIRKNYLCQQLPIIPPIIQPSIRIKVDTTQNKPLIKNKQSSTIKQEKMELQKVLISQSLENFLPNRGIKHENMEVQQAHSSLLLENILPRGRIKHENFELQKAHSSQQLENFLPNSGIKHEHIEVQQAHSSQLLKNILPSGSIKHEHIEVQQAHSNQLCKNFVPSGGMKNEHIEVQQAHSNQLCKNFVPSGGIKHEHIEVQQAHSNQLCKNFVPSGGMKSEHIEVQQAHSNQLRKNFVPSGGMKNEHIEVQQTHSNQLCKNFVPSGGIKHEHIEVQQAHSNQLCKNFVPSGGMKNEHIEVQQAHSSQLLINILPSGGIKCEHIEVQQAYSSQLLYNNLPSACINHENIEVQQAHSNQLFKNFVPSGGIKRKHIEVQQVNSNQLLNNFVPSGGIKHEHIEVQQAHSSQLLKNILPSGSIKHEYIEVQQAHSSQLLKNNLPSVGIKHENKEAQQALSRERRLKDSPISGIRNEQKQLTFKQRKMARKERFTFWATVAVRDFIAKSKNEDLIFSSLLCESQQKLIQEVAHQYKLKSVIFGYKKTRHIVLFRSSSADEYLQRCIEKYKGNVPVNFKVIPPTNR